jgi:hypothetical protein
MKVQFASSAWISVLMACSELVTAVAQRGISHHRVSSMFSGSRMISVRHMKAALMARAEMRSDRLARVSSLPPLYPSTWLAFQLVSRRTSSTASLRVDPA